MSEEMPGRRRAPTRAGAVLREDVLPALGLPVTEVAGHLRVTRQQRHRVPAEPSGVSPATALRLGKRCGNGPDLWPRMQGAYDLWQAKARLGDEIDAIPTLRAATG